MLLTICLVLLLVALLGGFWSGPRYGYAVGWSPLGVILLAVIALWLAGMLR